MARNIDYQFTAVPTQLFMCLDNNCRSTLFSLIQLSTYYETKNGAAFDGWFFRTNALLEEETNLSKNVLSGALDALYQARIVDIIPQEKGRSKTQGARKYRVNYDSFLKYQSIPIEECSCLNPDYGIVTSDYKKGTPLFQPREQLKRRKSDNNIDNINNTKKIDIIEKEKINNIDNVIIDNNLDFNGCHYKEELETWNDRDSDGNKSHPSNNGQDVFDDNSKSILNLNPIPSSPSISEDFIISQIPFVYSNVRRHGESFEPENYTDVAYDILDEYEREVKNWIGCIQTDGQDKSVAAARLSEVINGQEYRSQDECVQTALDLMFYVARCEVHDKNDEDDRF